MDKLDKNRIYASVEASGGVSTMPYNPHIDNLKHYNGEMCKSMIDKIYFMDKVDATVFVDFGCADGTLLKTLHKLFPKYTYIGYDINEEMIKIARKNCSSDITFTSDWKIVQDKIKVFRNEARCLILSSVIHEAYSYLNKKELTDFWHRIWNSDFGYIAIRDMMVSVSTSRPSDPISTTRIRQIFDHQKLQEWEAQWGSINENWSLVHFLLTYRYTENWSREVKENYLPINFEEFLNMIPKGYYPNHIEHYTLPFIRETVFKDFGIQLQDRTHLKLILEKKS